MTRERHNIRLGREHNFPASAYNCPYREHKNSGIRRRNKGSSNRKNNHSRHYKMVWNKKCCSGRMNIWSSSGSCKTHSRRVDNSEIQPRLRRGDTGNYSVGHHSRRRWSNDLSRIRLNNGRTNDHGIVNRQMKNRDYDTVKPTGKQSRVVQPRQRELPNLPECTSTNRIAL